MADYQTYNPLQILSVEAGANLANPYRFVKMSSGKVVNCDANNQSIGVLKQAVDSGQMASVISSGIALVEVGSGGVTENSLVTSDANGKAVLVAAIAGALAAITAEATGTSVVIPAGETPVTSTGAQPGLIITDPVITVNAPAIVLTGGALPVKINGIALDTVAENGFARIKLI